MVRAVGRADRLFAVTDARVRQPVARLVWKGAVKRTLQGRVRRRLFPNQEYSDIVHLIVGRVLTWDVGATSSAGGATARC